MKLAITLPIALLAAVVAAPVVASGNPATNGALPVPANHIVGVWSNVASIGPCNAAPNSTLRQTLMFHAGGTFLDNSRFPPAGLPVPGTTQRRYRSIGVGTWSYEPRSQQYTLDQQFDWFIDAQYDGYQTVHRTILLSNDGNQASGPVLTVRYAANGAVISESCGSALSTRI